MASSVTSSGPNLDTIPPELQTEILRYLLPTDITIRLRPVSLRPQPETFGLSGREYYERFGILLPSSWPEQWVLASGFGGLVPAEQHLGRHGLTAPPHSDAASPLSAPSEEKGKAREKRWQDEGLDHMDMFQKMREPMRSEDLNDWGEHVVVSRSKEGRGCCGGVVGVMLLDRVLCDLRRKLLYGSNTFSFPNVETLEEFALTLTPAARSLIKRIALNACGEAAYESGCTGAGWSLEKDIAGVELVHALKAFDGLKEVILAGVGPDELNQDGWSFQVEEDAEEWGFECADLVAKLDGVDDGDDEVEKHTNHCLLGETVIYKKEEGVEKMLGSLRLLGTRIVARGVEYVLEDDEKVVDVGLALANAEEAKAEEARLRALQTYSRGGW